MKGLKRIIQSFSWFQLLNIQRCRKIWKKENLHNFTEMGMRIFDRNRVKVGNGTYGTINVIQFDNHSKGVLIIGNYCSIAPEVSFLIDGEHTYDTITTYPFKQRYLAGKDVSKSKGDIVIDDDVWIGYRATILSGTHIGQGAIVAAGAVVVNDVPPYAIVGGVPAKVIKYRFTPTQITSLLQIDYQKFNKDIIKENVMELYQKYCEEKQLEKLPRITKDR